MRINPYFGTQQTPEAGREKQPKEVSVSAARLTPEPDQAKLSNTHAQVQVLAAQASQLPEIREAKVSALRESVQSGQYRPSPANIAHGLVSEMLRSRTA